MIILAQVAYATSIPIPARAAWTADLARGEGKIEFTAIGRPSMLRVVGHGDKPEGSLRIEGNQLRGVIHFKLDSLDTGISMRNRHMKEEYLETGKYPEASLTLDPLSLPGSPDAFQTQALPFTGKLRLHGVERAVSGTADLRAAKTEVEGVAKFGIKLSDFGIQIPRFAGITVADEVQIEAHSKAPAEDRP